MTDAERFGRCIGGGGLVVFPSDTVYGLACDPENRASVERLYRLKGRSAAKPSAVMFFDLDAALGGLPELGSRTEQAMRQLLPGGVTLLVANPRRRFELACGDDPETLHRPRTKMLAVRRPSRGSALSGMPGGMMPECSRLPW